MKQKAGYQDIPIGGVIEEAGTALQYPTGTKRRVSYPRHSERPGILVPVHVMRGSYLTFHVMRRFSSSLLDYCKGCGICASICPVDAIEMVKEE